ncbi:Metallo-peptidase family M12-domain-containing protein [Mycena galopus ATCC 62051]|nr:Metallo-peptidase family M12-domain-containing protein [Mycena galopus ATCC 62051]
MHFYLSFLALVVTFSLAWIEPAAAHSTSRRPLKRLANPSTLALEILPRQQLSLSASSSPFAKREPFLPRSTTLRYDDSFRLKIAAFDEVFHLHLRPNDHLIHPAARINYYSLAPDGTSYISHTKPLLRESVKAYWGEVIHADHSLTRMREDTARVVPSSHPAELGWARIMVHHQGDIDQRIAPVFEGAFSHKGVVYHVATKDNYLRHKRPLDADVSEPVDIVDSELVIWRDSDMMTAQEEHFAHTGEHTTPPPAPETCGHDRLSYNTDTAQNPILQKPATSPWLENTLGFFGNLSAKRDDVVGTPMGTNFQSSIGDVAGCPNTQKVLYMGVAADCVYTSTYGSRENATSQILNDWNAASALYKTTFNVSLGIVELQIQDEVCPNPVNTSFPWNTNCTADVTLNDRLSLFSQWRGDKSPDAAGLWHLMSGCPTGSEVGIAWLATLCQQAATGSAPSVVSGTAVSTAGLTEWQVVAHEIGHNFGAIHDCADGCNSTTICCPLTSTTCDANAQFIMSPVAEQGEKVFSQCTLGNICSLMTGASRTNTTCLQDPSNNVETISLQMCGNGIVEAGEQCDPGEGVTSPCCDSATCQFTANAVCDPDSSPCCTSQCGFAPTTQDRAAVAMAWPAQVGCAHPFLCNASNSGVHEPYHGMPKPELQHMSSFLPRPHAVKSVYPVNGPPRGRLTMRWVLVTHRISACYGGVCASGGCQSAGLFDTAKAWFTQNLQIAIPVSIVAGLVAILLLWVIGSAMLRCCRGRPDYAAPAPIMPPQGQGPDMRHQRLGSFDSAPTGPMGNGAGSGPAPPVRFDSRPPNFSGQQSGTVEDGNNLSSIEPVDCCDAARRPVTDDMATGRMQEGSGQNCIDPSNEYRSSS